MKHINLKSIFATFLLLMGVCQVSWGTFYIAGQKELVGCEWCLTSDNGELKGSPASVTFKNIPAGEYQFKLTNGSNWSGTDCISATYGVITQSGAKNNNMYITTSENANITFTMTNESQWKFSINAVASSSCTSPTIAWQTAPANGTIGGKMTATVKTNQPTPTIAWESSNANAATVSDAGLITYVAVGTTTITAKYTGNGDTYCAQEVSVSKEITVEGLAQSEWKIKGLFDGWKDHNFTENGDNTCSYTYDLTDKKAGASFDFVIYLGDTYYKGVEFTSSQPSETLKTEGNDAKITITTPGQYTFTWNYNTKKLTVTYPGSTPPTYTVTFDVQGHGTAPATQTVNSGAQVTKPADPTATGYTFGGWYTEVACITEYDFNTAVTADITLYAKWTDNTATIYTVTYNYNYDGATNTEATYTVGGAALPLPVPTREGYTFNGWYTAATDGTKIEGPTYTPTANITLYAQWTAAIQRGPYWYFDAKHTGWDDTIGDEWKLIDAGDYAYVIVPAYSGNDNLFKIFDCNPKNDATGIIANGNNIETGKLAGDITLTAEGGTYNNIKIESTTSAYKVILYYPETDTNPSDKFLVAAHTVQIQPQEKNYWFMSEKTQWGEGKGKPMAIHESGIYAYLQLTSADADTKFKVFEANNNAPSIPYYGDQNLYNSFNGADIELSKSDQGHNAVIGNVSSDWYVILYFPNTSVNPDDKYYLCASTAAPLLSDPYSVEFGVAGEWHGSLVAKSGNKVISSGDKVRAATFTAYPHGGYGVEGWYSDAEGTHRIEEAGTSTTYTQTITEASHTVYVKFKRIYAIYFKPNAPIDWEKKFVYTFSGDVWDTNNTPSAGVCPKYNRLDFGEMTQVNDSLYSYILTGATNTGSGNYYFAFNSADQKDNNNFWNCNAVYRGDFHPDMPVFISEKGQSASVANETKYYNKGLWMRYNDVEPGYNLWLDNKTDNVNTDEYRFEAKSMGGYVSTVSVTLEADKTYGFEIKNDKNAWFKITDPTECSLTNNTFTLYVHETGGNPVVIKPTITGTYTFRLNLANGKVEIEVIYPTTTYRLVYAEKNEDGIYQKYHPSTPHITMAKAGAKRDIVSLHVRCSIPDYIKDDLGHTTAINKWVPNQNTRWVYLQKTEDGNTWTNRIEREITETITENGVYNFTVEQDGNGGISLADDATKYTGNYYILTDKAPGGWENYVSEEHRLLYSDYAANNKYFDHYWCKYHDGGKVDLSFVVANDYSNCVSDTCFDELDNRNFTVNGIFDKQANIRFSWNSKSNTTDRAYIAGANNNLWLLNEDGKITSQGMQFQDRGNWVYYLNVTSKPGAKIGLQKRPYNTATDPYYVIGSKTDHCPYQLLDGTGRDSYNLRILYDFKSDHLLYGWLPDANDTVVGELPLEASMIFVRTNQGQANQLAFKKEGDQEGALIKVNEALGVLTIEKDFLLGSASKWEREYYWISFPFKVRVSDIFSAFVYGKQYVIQTYDGASRAQHGCFSDSHTYWRTLYPTDSLEVGKGYMLYISSAAVSAANKYANTDKLSIYFPSTGLNEINGKPIEVTVPEHKCEIERLNRKIYDSNWNLIGVPAWADLKVTSGTEPSNPDDEYKVLNIDGEYKTGFYYHFNTEESKGNTWTPTAVKDTTFQNMYAYLVQWHGTISWTASVDFDNPSTQGLQARRAAEAKPEEYTLRLELSRGETALDQTFVRLQEDGDVTADYDMNYDMTKIINPGANLYSLIGTNLIQAGANVQPLPAENTTVYVPVGVVADKDGMYRFSMPDGTEGMLVSLADHETGMLYNLATGYCEVPLTAGTYEQRFVLEIQPKKNVTTGCNESTADDGTLRKVLIDGNLYIQRGDALYDAAGRAL